MATNKVVRANSLKDLPFEFLLTVNGNIVCQRFFTIDDFIPKSVSSIGFKSVWDTAYRIIDEDMKRKSRIYTWYTEYSHFPLYEGQEKEEYVPSGYSKVDGIEMTEHGPSFYGGEQSWNNVIEMSFKMSDPKSGGDKRTVISRIWSADYYPEYVRKNISIVNSKIDPRYMSDFTAAMEKDSKDLAGRIIGLVISYCSNSKKKRETAEKK